ncbi:uncharacterized protein LOC129748441 [Uranotaenia lowii]|uniref:uncharacterized protein LOC129748441 n=1 Tax=Uranotaenia lowii TaxID=190385 RepID=UPI002479ED9B|nr:uncharacterized protein LOC129748441 [Uranotaenia lowii]
MQQEKTASGDLSSEVHAELRYAVILAEQSFTISYESRRFVDMPDSDWPQKVRKNFVNSLPPLGREPGTKNHQSFFHRKMVTACWEQDLRGAGSNFQSTTGYRLSIERSSLIEYHHSDNLLVSAIDKPTSPLF